MENNPPWSSGPGEILRHGLSLLKEDSDTNRRLAMICIDNSVELMIKTFLGLPERITGIKVPRKKYEELSENFPKLLDGLEEFASDKIKGINLGEIEWYHRLRNELYHQGNSLTVERNNVQVYSEIANVLFDNLFGFKLVPKSEDENAILGHFMQAWINFEKTVTNLSFVIDEKSRKPMDATNFLMESNKIKTEEIERLNKIRKIRNEVVHGKVNYKEVIKKGDIIFLNKLTSYIEGRIIELE